MRKGEQKMLPLSVSFARQKRGYFSFGLIQTRKRTEFADMLKPG